MRLRTTLLLGALLLAGVLVAQHLHLPPVPSRHQPTTAEPSPTERELPRDVFWLARNIYFEAKGEPDEGKSMIGWVTQKRVGANISHWGGNTVEGVVTMCKFKRKRPTSKPTETCQFSWVKKQRNDVPKNAKMWQRSVELAREVLAGGYTPPEHLREATYYLNPCTSSRRNVRWFKKKLVFLGKVGRHHFYREPARGEKVDPAQSPTGECRKKKRLDASAANRQRRSFLQTLYIW